MYEIYEMRKPKSALRLDTVKWAGAKHFHHENIAYIISTPLNLTFI